MSPNPAPVRFGTAGLRAPIGPGPAEMNVSTVTRASAGVASWLGARHSDGARLRVAVGFDARYGSQAMARAAAETFAGAGAEVTLIAEPAPTPVLAWLVRDRDLDAGVQITASHNPKDDNGYKLYLRGGSQLISPEDREIEAAIAAQPEAHRIARSSAVAVDTSVVPGYCGALKGLVGSGELSVLSSRRALRIVYTPMHGVGGSVLETVLRDSGFADVRTVPAQRWPDPEFPTVAFPNPEEPGATDLLLDAASAADADLLIALDPDADRCMIGLRDAQGGHRMLRGDEFGPLLATRIVPSAAADAPAPVVATTIVSSSLLSRIAAVQGWDYVETLTGFKYLARAADQRPGDLAFAYEEAIGTCPAPQLVADKDGIATAVLTAVWAAELAAEGSSLADALAELERTYGIVRTSQVSVRCDSPAAAGELIARLTAQPPAELAGVALSAESLDGTEGVRLNGTSGPFAVRIIGRPSGTEPKAKFYLQVSDEASAESRPSAGDAEDLLAALASAISAEV